MTIRHKRRMLELLREGSLGNATRIWTTVKELLASGFNGPVAIRYMIPSMPWQDAVPAKEVPAKMRTLLKQGYRQELMYFHEWPQPGTLMLNCEVIRSHDYIDLVCSFDKNIRTGQMHFSGLRAVEIVKYFAGSEWWLELNELWERLPDAAVDFTAHSYAAGIKSSHVIVWEVRNY